MGSKVMNQGPGPPRRVGRLLLGAEPLAEQLARLERVTWALTIVSALLGLFLFGLFAAFRSPGIGFVVAAVLVAPVIALAWLDFIKTRRLAARLEGEDRPAAPGPRHVDDGPAPN